MGCYCGKTVQGPKPPAKDKQSTLLSPSTEKPPAPEIFSVLLDGPVPSGCLEVEKQAPGGIALRVVEVEGGPIGLWNNRQRTEKVKKGDLVIKVRTAGQNLGKWAEGDEKTMTETLALKEIIELEVRHGLPQAAVQQSPSTEAAAQQSPNSGGTADAGTEAVAVQEPSEVPVQKAVENDAQVDQSAVATSEGNAIVEVADDTSMKVDAKSTQVEVSEAEQDSTKGECRFFC